MPLGVPLRQASEQYFTDSQSRAHFLRHSNGRWQTGQVFEGRGVGIAATLHASGATCRLSIPEAAARWRPGPVVVFHPHRPRPPPSSERP